MIYHLIFENSDLQFSTKEEATAYASSNEISEYVCISDVELKERLLAKKKREYGLYISNEMIELLGARNKILGLTGAQVTSMLSQLAGVRQLLETGALGTARTYIIQFQQSFPNHADIFQDAINDVNYFEQEFGL